MEVSLEKHIDDVIYLLDCCYSPKTSCKPNKEMITASSGISTESKMNFTGYLVEILEKQSPTPITVTHLHHKVAQIAWDLELSMPFYAELSKEQKDSLVIAPLAGPDQKTYDALPPLNGP